MTTSQAVSYPLRLPITLKTWLSEQAQRNFRSLNAEIAKRLEESRQAEQLRESHQ